jgi:hypothetical protein
MAAYNKVQDYVQQLNKAVHNWSSHTFKVLLTNTSPTATDTGKSNWTEITAGNGYTAGGLVLDGVTLTETGGTAKLVVADEVLTASGGSIGPFRYAAIYNDTPTSPADPGVCWYDYGSSVTLADGESFTLDFDAAAGLWQMS